MNTVRISRFALALLAALIVLTLIGAAPPAPAPCFTRSRRRADPARPHQLLAWRDRRRGRRQHAQGAGGLPGGARSAGHRQARPGRPGRISRRREAAGRCSSPTPSRRRTRRGRSTRFPRTWEPRPSCRPSATPRSWRCSPSASTRRRSSCKKLNPQAKFGRRRALAGAHRARRSDGATDAGRRHHPRRRLEGERHPDRRKRRRSPLLRAGDLGQRARSAADRRLEDQGRVAQSDVPLQPGPVLGRRSRRREGDDSRRARTIRSASSGST